MSVYTDSDRPMTFHGLRHTCAAEYSSIGINKIDSMLKQPHCPFVLYVGNKKLVKRKEFEQFISQKVII